VNQSSEWKYTVLHTFSYNRITGNDDGAHPSAGLIIDRNGALYGTTDLGGVTTDPYANGFGTVFRLTPLEGRRPLEKSAWMASPEIRTLAVQMVAKLMAERRKGRPEEGGLPLDRCRINLQ
jgi:uncharacterized repeat protein (TIGR03803 family)